MVYLLREVILPGSPYPIKLMYAVRQYGPAPIYRKSFLKFLDK
jgi:hypothetical protein